MAVSCLSQIMEVQVMLLEPSLKDWDGDATEIILIL